MTLLKNILHGIKHVIIFIIFVIGLVLSVYGPITLFIKFHIPFTIAAITYVLFWGVLVGVVNTVMDYIYKD